MLETLTRILPRRIHLEAKLKGVAGFTGSGAARIVSSAAGLETLEVELKGIAGLRAEVLSGSFFATLALKDGKGAAQFSRHASAAVAALGEGDCVEVRQNSQLVLRGALIPVRSARRL